IELDSNTLSVTEVTYLDQFGTLQEFPGWTYRDNHPASSTGQLLEIPGGPLNVTQCYVHRTVPYTWTPEEPVVESSTIEIQVGTADLPALYCAARLALGRELSRSELDKIEEWPKEEIIRQSLSMR